MVGGAGGAQGGHRVGETQLRQGHHVHIAFGDQHKACGVQRFAGFKQAIQLAALVEHRGFGRVQVFGCALAHDAAAKTNAFAFDVADREHHPIAEPVVALAVFFVDDHQAAFGQQGVVVVGEHTGQAAPTFGRIAQAKAFGDLP